MLETERLHFRKYSPADLPFLHALVSDPEVVRYIGDGTPKTKEQADAFFERILGGYAHAASTGLLLAVNKQTNQPIGHVGLVLQELDGVTETELGYWVARNYWGAGFATEAAAVFLKHGLDHLQLPRIISIIQPGNLASIGVAQKVGMNFERNTIYKWREVSIYSCNHMQKPSC